MNYGRYQIVKELGRGSMGVVYLARDPNIERMVAVKVLRQDRMGNELIVKRFIKEAKVAGRLSHPSTVTVHDIGEEHGEVYIAMEYLDGTPLSEVVKERRLDVKEVVDFGVQIAEALDYAHRMGVIHRDIKPSNIVVQPGGQVKITDFGIARIEDSSATLQTQTGETMGTPSYMSPEQVLGQKVDGRSDLFSLGVVLYELSTGKRPFGGEGKTLATVFNEIIQVTPPDPYIVSGQVPRELSKIIMKAIQKEPAKRFQSGAEFAEALRNCLGRERKATAIKTPVSSEEMKKKGYILPVAVGGAIAVIACGIFLFTRHEGAPPVKVPQESGVTAPSTEKAAKETVKLAPVAAPPGGYGVKAVKPATKAPAVTKPSPPPPIAVPTIPPSKKPEPPPVKAPAVRVAPRPATPPPVKPPVAERKLPPPRSPEPPPAEAPAVRVSPVPVTQARPAAGGPSRQDSIAPSQPPVAAKPLPKFAFLKVTTSPKGASVYVDGVKKGTSPVTIKLDLGSYRVRVSRPGYRDMERPVRLDRMTKYTVSEKLQPLR